jgi:hypothetical protein
MGQNPGFERLVEQRKSQVRECGPSAVMGYTQGFSMAGGIKA